MNTIGRIGVMYPSLSSAALVRLANASGLPAPAAPDPDDYDAAWNADQEEQRKFYDAHKDEMQATADAEAKARGEAPRPIAPFVPVPPPAKRDDGATVYTDASGDSKATGQTTPQVYAGRLGTTGGKKTAEAPATAPTEVQGPEEDNFPTVKPFDSEAQTGAAGGAPTVTVPAHWQPGTRGVQVHHGVSPEALAPGMIARGEELKTGELAARQRLEASLLQQAADVEAGKSAATQAHAARQELASLNSRQKTMTAEEMKKLDALSLQAQKKIDIDEAFVGGPVGRIASAIMVGIGQFGAALRGGPNVALQIVNEGIDTTIKTQLANINNARAAMGDRLAMLRNNVAAFGEERGVLAQRIQLYDKVAQLADGKRAAARSFEAYATYNDFIRGLQKEKAAALDDFARLTDNKVSETLTERYQPAQSPGSGMKGKDNLFVPTLGGYARDPETARKLNEKGALRMQIAENMHQISKLMDEAKRTSNPLALDDIDTRIQSLVNDALTKNTVLEGQGAMSESDKAVAAEAKGLRHVSVHNNGVPVLNSVIEKRQKRLTSAATNLLTQHRLEGEAYGIQRGTEQYANGPNGPTPVQRLEGRTAAPSKRTQGVDDLVRAPKGVAR